MLRRPINDVAQAANARWKRTHNFTCLPWNFFRDIIKLLTENVERSQRERRNAMSSFEFTRETAGERAHETAVRECGVVLEDFWANFEKWLENSQHFSSLREALTCENSNKTALSSQLIKKRVGREQQQRKKKFIRANNWINSIKRLSCQKWACFPFLRPSSPPQPPSTPASSAKAYLDLENHNETISVFRFHNHVPVVCAW